MANKKPEPVGQIQELYKVIDDAWFLLHLKIGKEKDSIPEYAHFKMGNFASEAEAKLFVLRQILAPLATHELVESDIKARER